MAAAAAAGVAAAAAAAAAVAMLEVATLTQGLHHAVTMASPGPDASPTALPVRSPPPPGRPTLVVVAAGEIAPRRATDTRRAAAEVPASPISRGWVRLKFGDRHFGAVLEGMTLWLCVTPPHGLAAALAPHSARCPGEQTLCPPLLSLSLLFGVTVLSA